nr:hypothetical protein [Tanacetum cinerariifolium]
ISRFKNEFECFLTFPLLLYGQSATPTPKWKLLDYGGWIRNYTARNISRFKNEFECFLTFSLLLYGQSATPTPKWKLLDYGGWIRNYTAR